MGKTKKKPKRKIEEKPFERESGLIVYFNAEKVARKAFLAELHQRCVKSVKN